MELLALVGAAAAWLGVTLQSTSAQRRGGAVGLAVTGLGLALAAAAGGRDALSAAAIATGGVLAAVLQLRGEESSSRLLPPGLTPRLVSAIAVLGVVVLVGAGNLGAPAGVARLAGVIVALVAGGQVLSTDAGWAALRGGSAMALGLGALGEGWVAVAAAFTSVALAVIEPGRRMARTQE
jgi:hypothetical protein